MRRIDALELRGRGGLDSEQVGIQPKWPPQNRPYIQEIRLRNRILVLLLFTGCFVATTLGQDSRSNFPRFNFNVGGGFGDGRGDVGSFVGNSFFAVGGAGMNFSRVFGVSGEYMYYDLTPRQNVSESQGLQSASGELHAFSLNGLVRAPFHFDRFRPYAIFGVGFYDRRVSSSTGPVFPGSICQPSWVWWDIYCVNGRTPSSSGIQDLGSFSKIAGGYNYGGGVTYSLNRWHNSKVYVEYRYHKAYQSDVQTIVWPFTVGLRW